MPWLTTTGRISAAKAPPQKRVLAMRAMAKSADYPAACERKRKKRQKKLRERASREHAPAPAEIPPWHAPTLADAPGPAAADAPLLRHYEKVLMDIFDGAAAVLDEVARHERDAQRLARSRSFPARVPLAGAVSPACYRLDPAVERDRRFELAANWAARLLQRAHAKRQKRKQLCASARLRGCARLACLCAAGCAAACLCAAGCATACLCAACACAACACAARCVCCLCS